MNNEEKPEFISDIVGKISHAKDEDYTDGMPAFDLGQQILAQQRKIAALKRKSPSAANSVQPTKPAAAPKIKPFEALIEQPMSPQQRIIADIIAREIQILTSLTR
ncbi:MAG: hypothetical protein ABFD79_15990 [Phycisphaerales bacterium]